MKVNRERECEEYCRSSTIGAKSCSPSSRFHFFGNKRRAVSFSELPVPCGQGTANGQKREILDLMSASIRERRGRGAARREEARHTGKADGEV